jgi:hypothetical protein
MERMMAIGGVGQLADFARSVPSRVRPIVDDTADYGRYWKSLTQDHMVGIGQAPGRTNTLIGLLKGADVRDAVARAGGSVASDYQALLDRADGVRSALAGLESHWEGYTPVVNGKENAVSAVDDLMAAAKRFAADFPEPTPPAAESRSGSVRALRIGLGIVLGLAVAVPAGAIAWPRSSHPKKEPGGPTPYGDAGGSDPTTGG